MRLLDIFVLGIALSMDAFAVSICKGLSVEKTNLRQALTVGVWFGGFQAVMPFIGYVAGTSFSGYIQSVDHWVSFILLALIGANMIKESFSKKEETQSDSFAVSVMAVLAVATSIDALIAGITLMDAKISIYGAIAVIGITTFIFSAFGLKIGNVFGNKYKSGAEITGGVILILLGVKILLEHLGVIDFGNWG